MHKNWWSDSTGLMGLTNIQIAYIPTLQLCEIMILWGKEKLLRRIFHKLTACVYKHM